MGAAAKFLEMMADGKKQETFSTVLSLFRSVLRLVRPQHPLVTVLNTVMAGMVVADDAVVDAMLARKLRTLRATLSTSTDDIQRRLLERRIAAIAAAITE